MHAAELAHHPAGLVGKTYEQIDASSDVGGGVKYDATGFVGGAFKFAVNASREDTPAGTPIDWFMDPESAGVDVVAMHLNRAATRDRIEDAMRLAAATILPRFHGVAQHA